MVEVKKLEKSHQYTHSSNYEENKQPVRSLQSDRVITATTNAKKSSEQNVYREHKFLPQNETKESEAYCNDMTCYCRKKKQQETVSKEDNDVNELNRENIAINERLGFFEMQIQSMTRYLQEMNYAQACQQNKGHSDWMQQ